MVTVHKGDLFGFYLCRDIKAKHFVAGGAFKVHSKERRQIVLTCRIIYKPLNDVPEGAKVLIHARISLNLRVCVLHCRAFKCIFYIYDCGLRLLWNFISLSRSVSTGISIHNRCGTMRIKYFHHTFSFLKERKSGQRCKNMTLKVVLHKLCLRLGTDWSFVLHKTYLINLEALINFWIWDTFGAVLCSLITDGNNNTFQMYRSLGGQSHRCSSECLIETHSCRKCGPFSAHAMEFYESPFFLPFDLQHQLGYLWRGFFYTYAQKHTCQTWLIPACAFSLPESSHTFLIVVPFPLHPSTVHTAKRFKMHGIRQVQTDNSWSAVADCLACGETD